MPTTRCWYPEPAEGLEETSKQLVEETRQPRPVRPGSPRAYDYEYRRNGVSNPFMLYAPLEGWRRVEVRSGAPGPAGRMWCGDWWTMTTRRRPASSSQCLDRRIPNQDILKVEPLALPLKGEGIS